MVLAYISIKWKYVKQAHLAPYAESRGHLTSKKFWNYFDRTKVVEDNSFESFQRAGKRRNPICHQVAPDTKNGMPILSSYPHLWGVCVMTFFDISSRLAVKYKKHISPIGGATYRKYYRPILSSYPNLWEVSVLWHFTISLTVYL